MNASKLPKSRSIAADSSPEGAPPPFGDRQWRLYKIGDDPVETNDLSNAQPELFAEMVAAYDRYAEAVSLIEVPDDYNPVSQVQKNVDRNQVKEVLKKVPVTIE